MFTTFNQIHKMRLDHFIYHPLDIEFFDEKGLDGKIFLSEIAERINVRIAICCMGIRPKYGKQIVNLICNTLLALNDAALRSNPLWLLPVKIESFLLTQNNKYLNEFHTYADAICAICYCLYPNIEIKVKQIFLDFLKQSEVESHEK